MQMRVIGRQARRRRTTTCDIALPAYFLCGEARYERRLRAGGIVCLLPYRRLLKAKSAEPERFFKVDGFLSLPLAQEFGIRPRAGGCALLCDIAS